MNKKGFTLVELLAVITLLGIIALVAIPTIDSLLEKNKEKIYQTQIKTIEESLKTWADANASILPENNESITINLSVLKLSGFLDNDFKDSTTGKCFSNDIKMTIKNVKNNYSYKVDTSSEDLLDESCTTPIKEKTIVLKGEAIVTISNGTDFVDPGYIIIGSDGMIEKNVASVTIKDSTSAIISSIPTDVNGTYIVTYTIDTVNIERKVVVE